MVGRPRPKVVCRRWGPKWATNGRQLVDPSRPTIQYFTSSYTSCGTLSPDLHTATVVIKLVVMTTSPFFFSFFISHLVRITRHLTDVWHAIYNIQYILLLNMDENRAKILQGLVCESSNCFETLYDSCDLCKRGLCELCYQGYHLCVNNGNQRRGINI